MRKIMVVYSEYSGHGHKSICNALVGQAPAHGVEIVKENGYCWGGKVGAFMEKAYIPLINTSRTVWKILYNTTDNNVDTCNNAVYKRVKEKALESIMREKPELILIAHGAFLDPLIRLTEENNIDIPVVCVLADIDKLSKIYYNRKCRLYFCPTEEIKNTLSSFGLLSAHMQPIAGLPVGRTFRTAREQIVGKRTFDPNNIKVLFYYPNRNCTHIAKFLKTVYDNTNWKMTVITGERNMGKIYSYSDNAQKTKTTQPIKRYVKRHIKANGWQDRIFSRGYVSNMYNYMKSHDIFLSKGGPNTIFESVTMGLPIVSYDTLPGQEEGNGPYLENNGLGLYCTKLPLAFEKLEQLVKDDCKLLREISENQFKFSEPDAAEQILNFCTDFLDDKVNLQKS